MIEKDDAPFPGIAYLNSLPVWDGKQVFDIDTPAKILALLNNPQDKVRSVHVSGTNGKGTVCAYLAAMLFKEQKNVGQFTSPHLSDVTERCLINGLPVSHSELSAAIEIVREMINGKNLEPTYFEMITAACFYEFAKRALDYTVIEVGLGGRLDATNVIIKPEVSVITSIAFDHTQHLGATLAAIAGEKAGIIKPASPCYVGTVSSEAKEVIKKRAAEIGSKAEFFGEDFFYDQQSSTIKFADREYFLDLRKHSLKVPHQIENAVLAARVGFALGLSEEAVTLGLQSARWPGRLELFQLKTENRNAAVPVLIDAAHNPAGVESLFKYLASYAQEQGRKINFLFILSMLERKEWQEMLNLFREFSHDKNFNSSFIFTSSDSQYAIPPQELLKYFGDGSAIASPSLALQYVAEHAEEDTLIVVTGSIYLLGVIRPLLTDEPFRTII